MNYAQLQKDVKFQLHRGDQICLLMRKHVPIHKYIVCFEEKKEEEEVAVFDEEAKSLEGFAATTRTAE